VQLAAQLAVQLVGFLDVLCCIDAAMVVGINHRGQNPRSIVIRAEFAKICSLLVHYTIESRW
jgi:hypothetical protein